MVPKPVSGPRDEAQGFTRISSAFADDTLGIVETAAALRNRSCHVYDLLYPIQLWDDDCSSSVLFPIPSILNFS